MKKLILLILIAGMLVFGCASQTDGQAKAQAGGGIQNTTGDNQMTVKKGDTVRVDYVGTLQNGTVFDTSIKEEAVRAKFKLRPSYAPLEFSVGAGQMIKGFDDGVVGMKVGEEKTVTIKPSEAYGEKNAKYVISVTKDQIGAEVVVGTELTAQGGQQGTVTSVSGNNVTIDFNHPLAGKTLIFRIILRQIVK